MNLIKFVWRNILVRKYLWQYFDGFKKTWDEKLKETVAFTQNGGG